MVFNHEVYGEKFYSTTLFTERTSGTADLIPVLISERLFKGNLNGQYVRICGHFRSYNKYEENRNRMILSVFVMEIEIVDEEISLSENEIEICGCLCKDAVYRTTPLGRNIADLLLAVNRPYGKSDYIPCVCWGRNAKYAPTLSVGTKLRVFGRIQSREYQKKISEEEFETRTAYEVSIGRIELVEENADEK